MMVTPNMGATNVSIAGGNWFPNYSTTAGGTEMVWQNNPNGYLLFGNATQGLINDRNGGATTAIVNYVQDGPGTVVMGADVNAYTFSGLVYLDGGCTEITADSCLGVAATASMVYLNGGTVVGGASFAMDSGGGVHPRPITLLGNGGGLAAVSGTTLTVDGQIGSGSGTGPLVIGIPASAANGGVVGLLPGSGVGTGNTNAVYANGTVALTYANGVAGNYFYGGVTILGGATLAINSQYDLGGADYGGLTFTNGTLQYTTTLATGAAGAALDISGATVKLAGNATIDENGQTVAYANAIGGSGSGSLTVTNSAAASSLGGLFLNGGNTYTGGTIVAAGAVLGGTNTISGNVTWTTNSYAALSPVLPLTVSGTVALTNTTMQIQASGLTAGTFTLLTATGGITSGSTVNPAPSGSGVFASGYGGTVSINGNSVILTVTLLGVTTTWTDGLADQNWSEGGNWTGGTVPQNSGDSATFGTGGVGTPVNLNQNETVGTLIFNNASSYTITGANTLTLNNSGHGVGINVTAGMANAVNTAVALNDNITATVNSGDSLTLGGTIANTSSPKTLTVNGGGSLVVSGSNSYGPAAGTVGTTLGGATIQVGNNSSLGAGDVNVTGNSTLQSGAAGLNLANNLAVAVTHTVTVANNGNNLTLSGIISGGGAVSAMGAGVLALTNSNNTYSGGTTFNGGVVGVSADGATPGSTGNLGVVPASFTANDLLFNGGDLLATATLTLQTNRGLGIGSTLLIGTANTTAFVDAAAGKVFTIPGVIGSAGNSGTNSLTVNSEVGSTGTVVLSGANTFNGTNVISAGVEQLGNPLALQFATLNYNYQGGILDLSNLTALTLGGLTGSENLTLTNDLAGAVALTIGNNNTSATYGGTLGDNGAGATLTKTGGGTIAVGSFGGGGASYTGATIIDNGTLTLDGNGSVIMSTSANLQLAGSLGISTLNLVDFAIVNSSGGVYLGSEPTGGSDGGNGYPSTCSLTVQNNASLTAASLSYGGVGVSTRLPNCSVTVANNGMVNISGAFQLGNIAGSATPTGQVNLNGGTLAVGNFLFSSSAANRPVSVNFNGGTLEANANDPSGSQFLPALTGLTVNVQTNGALIDPNNYNITIAAPMAGAGGLTNFGPGTLSLSGSNSYAGGTVVSNNSTLNVINTTGSATGTNTVTVLPGGTLEGNGIIAGNVVWQLGALAGFTAGATATPLNVGAVTVNNNTVTVNVPGSTPLAIGTYTLMNYTAAGSTGTFNPTPTFTGAGVVSGLQASISSTGSSVILTVSPNVTYDVWDVDLNGNWTDAAKWSSNPTVPGYPGDAALLGVGSVVRTVTLNTNESLGYLTFTNVNGFVVVNPANTLTLDNNGNGAYISVSGGSNVIQTAVSLNDSLNIAVSSGDVLTISGVVSNSLNGARSLTVGGTGKVILANTNAYGPSAGTTGTTLTGGTLQAGSSTALGLGDVNVTGASTLQAGTAVLNLTNNLSLNSGVTLTFNDNGDAVQLAGNISGSGALLKIGSGTNTLTAGNSFGGGVTITNGTLVLAASSSGGNGSITNAATLQLANDNAFNGALVLNSGSTLQLRSDANDTFQPNSVTLQNAADILNFDVNNLTSGHAGYTLSLADNLAFTLSQANQVINVTGGNGYTLGLGSLSAISATSHTPYQMVDLNVIPGLGVSIGGFTSGNWGDFLDFTGGGSAIVTGGIGNTSNGSVILCVNSGTTVTLQGQTTKSAGGDAYRYLVQNGVLVADNSSALINDTTGANNNMSLFTLGPVTNIVYTGATSLPTGYQTVNTNNNVNCAFYLGDTNNTGGNLTLSANVTNNISDGDAGFTNNGVMTLGGQNTSGVNTFANNIILGWTANRGKSVTLVAAPGGEVDFTGNLLANGTDKTAGITVGNPNFTGLVKLTGTNTYGGPTLINAGTLALANNGVNDAYIGNSTSIVISPGATLDVTSQSSENQIFALGSNTVSQVLSGAGTLNGSLGVGSLGTVAPGSATTTGMLTVNDNVSLGGAVVLKLNNIGTPTNDELVVNGTLTGGGVLTVTNLGPALVSGSTFHLFNSAVTGFSTVTLPVADNNHSYTWNNQLAANGTIVLTSTTVLVNTNAATAHFKAVATGSSLQFNWAPDHQGWQLYTNSVSLTVTNAWHPVTGSASTTNETLTINPTQPQVFFQLRYP